jgi:hypothetical protein
MLNVERVDGGDVSSNSAVSRRSWIAKLTLRAICDCVSFCVGRQDESVKLDKATC